MSMTREQIEAARLEGRRVTYTSPYSGDRVFGTIVKTTCLWPRNDGQLCAEIHDDRILGADGYYDIPWSDLELAPPKMEKFRVQFDIELDTDALKNLEGVNIPCLAFLGLDFEKLVHDRVNQLTEIMHSEWRGASKTSNMRVCPVHQDER